MFKFVFLAMFLVLSLSLNIAMFVGGTVYSAASSTFGALTGIRTVATRHTEEVADLGSRLVNERKASKMLRKQVARVSQNLISERRVTKKLRGKTLPLRKAINSTSKRISKRALLSSKRKIASMAGKAIPAAGTAIVVAMTIAELKDLCDTLKDMAKLKKAFDLNLQTNTEDTIVCAVRIPTKEEVWATAKASPSKAWAAAKKVTPTLEDIKDYQFPEVDWTGAWNSTLQGSDDAWSATKNGTATTIDVTKGATGSAVDSVKKRWADWLSKDAEK